MPSLENVFVRDPNKTIIVGIRVLVVSLQPTSTGSNDVRFAQTAFLHVIAMTYISTCPTGHVAMQHLRSPTDRFRVNASKVEVSWAGPTFGRDSTCTVLHNATHVT
ncbi:unnamed protein product [Mesocestoides corti]|uniref:Fibronectin type-III domain-containing protein n=1 Tax=Mesocestoides corti TaxID=53468 RepID=A0A0R3U814_MESCO|nr:unnamed protein product [Mesocestoides corti]